MAKPKLTPDIKADTDAIVARSNHKLSPSDLTFLWDECKRCFYLKVVRGFNQPATAFPSILGAIDSRMTSYYSGLRTKPVAPILPPGVIRRGQQWVQSQPVAMPGSASTC